MWITTAFTIPLLLLTAFLSTLVLGKERVVSQMLVAQLLGETNDAKIKALAGLAHTETEARRIVQEAIDAGNFKPGQMPMETLERFLNNQHELN